MAKLATVEAIRLRLNLGDLPEINAKVSASLDAATQHLISRVRTEFDRQEKVDTYWLDPVQAPWTGDFVQLYLSQGFVFVDPSAVPDPIRSDVRVAISLEALATTDILSPNPIIIENRKGLVLLTESSTYDLSIPTWRIADKFFMSVSYTAGFLTKPTEFGPVFLGVPAWLEEASLLIASSLFLQGSDCDRKESNSSLASCNATLQALLTRYIRFYPSARKPIL